MDVETLIDMLEYSPNEADSFKFKAESDDGQVKVFNPDIPDFSLEATSLNDGKRDLPGPVLNYFLISFTKDVYLFLR